jgi:hypothetical protein
VKRLPGLLAAFMLGAAAGMADEVTLLKDVMMRGDHVLASIKAGTAVEIVSRNDQAVIIRYHGQIGAIPLDSVPEVKHPEVAPPEAPAVARVTPAIVLGPRTLFLANDPGDSPDGLRQYIPDDENIDRWEHMASTRVIKGSTDPQAYLASAQESAKRANPRNRAASWPFDGEKVLELVEYIDLPNRTKFAQWSLTRANRDDGGNLVVCQYAVRYYAYGDSTDGVMERERNSTLNPFVARLSFEEATTIPKPHNVRLTVTTEATVESAFPGGSFVYAPDVSLGFAGNMPDGIDIPTGKSPHGRIACLALTQVLFLNPEGVAMPAGDPRRIVRESFAPMDSRRQGPFNFQAGLYDNAAFTVRAGGAYTLKVNCHLKDNSGKPYLVVGSQKVMIVDTRAHDPSSEPASGP